MRLSSFAGFHDLFLSGIFVAPQQVLADGARKQMGRLQHHADP